MFICPTCGGNFEARKKRGVYACGTRRRKPGMCSNTLTLPIKETDEKVLEEVVDELLGPKYIEELLSLVE